MEKHILLERLKIRKPPTEFHDVCLKTFCAVRATLTLEDFNVEGLTRRQFCCAKGFSLPELAFVPPFSGIYLSICPSIYLSTYPSIHPSIHPSIYMFVCRSILSTYIHLCILHTHMLCHLVWSINFQYCHICSWGGKRARVHHQDFAFPKKNLFEKRITVRFFAGRSTLKSTQETWSESDGDDYQWLFFMP